MKSVYLIPVLILLLKAMSQLLGQNVISLITRKYSQEVLIPLLSATTDTLKILCFEI